MRATGRTTRLVDMYVQKLFNNPNRWIIIEDHHNQNDSNRYLTTKIKYRIRNEHPGVAEYLEEKGNSLMLRQ